MLSEEVDSITQVIQTIFSDRYLQKHPRVKTLILRNKKGYVQISEIKKEEIFEQSFGKQVSSFTISEEVKAKSKNLICRNLMIRRMNDIIRQQTHYTCISILTDNLRKSIDQAYNEEETLEDKLSHKLQGKVRLHSVTQDPNHGMVYLETSYPPMSMYNKETWGEDYIYVLNPDQTRRNYEQNSIRSIEIINKDLWKSELSRNKHIDLQQLGSSPLLRIEEKPEDVQEMEND